MNTRACLFTILIVLIASVASATTFVVPTDEELVRKSEAIVLGTIESATVVETGQTIETVYELRVERAMKGAAKRGDVIRIVSPGGAEENRGVIVPAAARFRDGERALVFLTLHNGRWTPTDLTLGKFRFATSTRGERLLVRDMDEASAYDEKGRPHGEKMRREAGFISFIEETARGGRGKNDYVVSSAEATIAPDGTATASASATTFAGATYTSWINNQPSRWPSISTGISVWKRSDQNISGASDGGVAEIQNGLAAWTNDCASIINLKYAGQRATASTNYDGINVVEYNDPQSRISGSWTGSGTVAITFISYAGSHTFSSRTWWNITDADVVFQNGFTASSGAFTTAMTHELGHAIGWRHSNQHYDGTATCNSTLEECTSAAIMNSTVGAAYGYTLQPWDVNAARTVYPGSTCGTTCTAPAITAQPKAVSIVTGGSATLTVTASGTTPLAYQWYTGASGVTSLPISGATSSSVTVKPSATTSYWVRVSNACGAVNSAAATVTVTTSTTLRPRADFNADGRSDIVWRNATTGANAVWYMSGASRVSTASISGVGDLNWELRSAGDMNGDGKPDLIWRNRSTGANVIWFMSGATRTSSVSLPSLTDVRWNIVSVADFNADGKNDIVWRHASTGQNTLWTMNGATRLSTVALQQAADLTWQLAGSGDFNGDRKPDLVWRNSKSGQNAVWYMNGATPTGTATFPAVTDLNWDLVAIADMNNDAKTDLVWRHRTTGANVLWLMSGVTRTSYASMPTLADLTWKIAGPR